MSIHDISQKFIILAEKITHFSQSYLIDEKLRSQLSELAYQCQLSADKIVRDHTDEGIALDSLQTILGMFNHIVL